MPPRTRIPVTHSRATRRAARAPAFSENLGGTGVRNVSKTKAAARMAVLKMAINNRRFTQRLSDAALNAAALEPWVNAEDSPPQPDDDPIGELLDATLFETYKLPPRTRKRRTNRMNREKRDAHWTEAYPSLIEATLNDKVKCTCSPIDLRIRHRKVLCISITGSKQIAVPSCKCAGSVSRIISLGYFPASPTRPRLAFSLDLLHFFHEVLMRGAISKYAVVGALQAICVANAFTFPPPPIPRLREPFYHTYRNWLEVKNQSTKRVEDFLTELTQYNGGDTSVFESAALSQRCPACCYRQTEEEWKEILILASDGNNQQRRLASAGARKDPLDKEKKLLAELIVKSRPDDYDKKWDNYPEDVGCIHSFNADEKPTRMARYDETGLLNCVCRHGCAFRYLNMLTGERYGWIYYLLKVILNAFNGKPMRIGFYYDVGCKWGPFLKRYDYLLSLITEVRVNAFHQYGHPKDCQIMNGPRSAEGHGRTDAEDTERDWWRMSHLVSFLLQSGPRTRDQILSAHAMHMGDETVLNLPSTLATKFKNSLKLWQKLEAKLTEICKQPVTIHATSGEVQTVIMDEAFVQEQCNHELEFYKNVTPHKRKNKGTDKILSALRAERKLAKRLFKACNGDYDKLNDEDLNSYLVTLPGKRAASDKLLKQYRQTREDWKEDGELWKGFHETPLPGTLIATAMKAEIDNNRRIIIAEASADPDLSLLRTKQKNAAAKTDNLLKSYGYARADWEEGTTNYKHYQARIIGDKLSELMLEIYGEVFARSLELRDIHANLAGQKNKIALIKKMSKRFPKIQKNIDKVNALIGDLPAGALPLPEGATLELLTLDSFRTQATDDSAPPKDGDAPADESDNIVIEHDLWTPVMILDVLRFSSELEVQNREQQANDEEPTPLNERDAARQEIYKHIKNQDLWFAWGISKDVRLAIDCHWRIQRCREELGLIKTELQRLRKWTVVRVVAVLLSLGVPVQQIPDGCIKIFRTNGTEFEPDQDRTFLPDDYPYPERTHFKTTREYRKPILAFLKRNVHILRQLTILDDELIPSDAQQDLHELKDCAVDYLTAATDKINEPSPARPVPVEIQSQMYDGFVDEATDEEGLAGEEELEPNYDDDDVDEDGNWIIDGYEVEGGQGTAEEIVRVMDKDGDLE